MRESECIRLILAGDVMTGRGIDQILPHPAPPEIYEPWVRDAKDYVALAEERNGPIPRAAAFDYIWGEALPAMHAREPALRIINLETAITAGGTPWPGKGIQYRMHPNNIPCLKVARIDACVLANNHVLDWGHTGLSHTLAALKRADLQCTGAGENLRSARTPAIFPFGERHLLLFAFAHGSSGVPREWAAGESEAGVNRLANLADEGLQQVAEALGEHRRGGDRAIVSLHWGDNWGYDIAGAQRTFAHRLIEELDVDLIYGHSSHHPMGIEVHRQRAILYGCGDLINDYEGIRGHEKYCPHLRLLYCVDLAADSGALQRLELIPFEAHRLQLRHAASDDREWLLQTLNRQCRALGSEVQVEGGADGTLLTRQSNRPSWPI